MEGAAEKRQVFQVQISEIEGDIGPGDRSCCCVPAPRGEDLQQLGERIAPDDVNDDVDGLITNFLEH